MARTTQIRARLCQFITIALFGAYGCSGLFAQSKAIVPEMTRYTDTGFGFSFWYPAAWKVTEGPADSATEDGWYKGATIIKEIDLRNPAASDPVAAAQNDQPLGVTLQELIAPAGLTELGTHSPSPVGVDQRYFFDSATHRWMYAWLTQLAGDDPPGQRVEKIVHSTMDGLPIFQGAARHGAEVIVPLDPSHFLAIFTNDPGGDNVHSNLAETVVSTRKSAVKGSPQDPAETIRREAVKLRAIGEPLGFWYKDGGYVYEPNGDVVRGADPKTFVPFPPDGLAASMFASDGVRVYRARSGAIAGADPKTFVPTSQFTATDARHSYDWTTGSLKIGDLTERP